MKRTILMLLAVLGCYFVGFSQSAPETIPDFTFYRLDKTPFVKNDLAKNRTLFLIFFDTECEHCQHAIQYLNEHHKEFSKAAIYMITLSDLQRIEFFMNKFAPNLKKDKNITLLIDAKYQFIPTFHPKKYPSLYLYSPQKKLILFDDNEQNMPQFMHVVYRPDS